MYFAVGEQTIIVKACFENKKLLINKIFLDVSVVNTILRADD